MATRTSNIGRVFEFNEDPLYDDLPVIAADTIFEGSAVGESVSTGTFRPMVSGDAFGGFAAAKVDNELGAAGDAVVRVRKQGTVKLDVVGVASIADHGAAVYASDDDTFTLTASTHTQIGKVGRYISGTTCMVRLQSAQVQSI